MATQQQQPQQQKKNAQQAPQQPAQDDQRAGPPANKSLVVRIAQRFSVDPDKLLDTLKRTAFRQRADRDSGQVREPTNEEMMALLIIADQYKLNPFTRELYAFFDRKSGAIVPIVSVDGWLRIINEQPSLRGIEFRWSDETVTHKSKTNGREFTCHVWMECAITRSDRDAPVVVREYFAEVVRAETFPTPWDTHPNRMHRHKVVIQAGRVAFGFGGIYDPDEGARIIEGEASRVPDGSDAAAALNAGIQQLTHQPTQSVPTTIKPNAEAVRRADEAEQAAAKKRSQPIDLDEQQARNSEPPLTYAAIADKLRTSHETEDGDAFAEAADLIRHLPDPTQQAELRLLVEQLEQGQQE